MRYPFEIIKLWEIPQERILGTKHYDLWPLAAVMKDATLASTQTVVDKIARAPVGRRKKQQLNKTLALLAGMRLPKLDLFELLRRNHMLEEIFKEGSLWEIFEDEKLPELEAQVTARVEAKLKPQIEAELKPQIEAELKARVESELKPQIEAEVAAEHAVQGARHMAQVALESRFGPCQRMC